MVRHNAQPDTFLDWSAVAELTGGPVPTTPAERSKTITANGQMPVHPDPLTDLLETPIRKLTAPLWRRQFRCRHISA
jgi:hypothetical protein